MKYWGPTLRFNNLFKTQRKLFMAVSSGLFFVHSHVDVAVLSGYLHCVALEDIGGDYALDGQSAERS